NLFVGETGNPSPPIKLQKARSRPAAAPVGSKNPDSRATAIEPAGGAVPLGSPFYIERRADAQFKTALARQDSLVLVKGPRQVGKTSLLARGLQQAREAGDRIVLTDLQKLTAAQLASAEALFNHLAERIADQLDLDISLDVVWNPRRSWNVNFERFLRREVLDAAASPVVWALDEVDRLFACPFGSEVFGMFRSWHNERSLNPEGPWGRLTLAIAYATEAHLFITDLNQSPFNVGTRLALEDFTQGEVQELNRRYGSPLKNDAERERFYSLLGGHPYLTRRGLEEMVADEIDLSALEARADREEGPFADHLRRIVHALQQDDRLADFVRGLLHGIPRNDPDSFYRLRSAGILAGETVQDARLRCRLYALYLDRHLSSPLS
ncbi:MAG TPA: AAA-like domain-containing protein, partial [Chthonomonadaceae bacterium]|nr:AAA-like domain-containing protein [Chthonomonadaceae bacterium]